MDSSGYILCMLLILATHKYWLHEATEEGMNLILVEGYFQPLQDLKHFLLTTMFLEIAVYINIAR